MLLAPASPAHNDSMKPSRTLHDFPHCHLPGVSQLQHFSNAALLIMAWILQDSTSFREEVVRGAL